jgi:hypothetical protein
MYKALISFSGVISMRKGEVKAITDNEVVADLLRAGYIEEVKKPTEKTEPTATKQPQKKTAKKK